MSASMWGNIPKKRCSSAAIFLNEAGEVLIVKPTYREKWLLPGGVGELNESPLATCEREVKEEIGLDIQMERLLAVDYCFSKGNYPEGLKYIFYGGVLSAERISDVVLQEAEISECKFIEVSEVFDYLVENVAARASESLKALASNSVAYLEGQKRIF